MAHSQIIKDIANSTIDTVTALKRSKVLLNELNNGEILEWVNHEIEGYPDDAKIPDYRLIFGEVKGSYLVGRLNKYMSYQNVPIPLGNISEDWLDYLHHIPIKMGIDAIRQSLSDGKRIEALIPAEIYQLISSWNNDPFMKIVSASIELNMSQISDIMSKVENRLIDIFLLLEKQFGNLDELDINIDDKNTDERNAVIEQIIYIIYNDHSVEIGDSNVVKNSTISSVITD